MGFRKLETGKMIGTEHECCPNQQNSCDHWKLPRLLSISRKKVDADDHHRQHDIDDTNMKNAVMKNC
jgi:hypothetical protein